MVKLESITKKYKSGNKELEVLKGVNLTIAPKEFVSIQGPSGSGKSTLLNLIGGIDYPDQGKIFVDGLEISALKDGQLSRFRNQKIGFVFQAFHLEPTYSALENVMLPLMIAGVSKKERRARAVEALRLVGLQDRAGHRPGHLSGGEQQRVSIARAIINDPGILLADEPTGNLDSKNGQLIMDVLKMLNVEKGYTILMVTHNAELAEQTDRVITLMDGHINVSCTKVANSEILA